MFSNPFHRESNRDILQRIDKRVKELGDDNRLILRHLEKVMATIAELEVKLTNTTDQVAKAAAEISAEIAALKKAIEDGAVTTPAIDASMERLAGLAQALDDLNPDAPPPPPEEQARRNRG